MEHDTPIIPIIPAKKLAETHEEYMQNFVSMLVETTQQSSSFEHLDNDTRSLFRRIIDGCRQPMVTAAKNRHSTAQIFIYMIAMQGKKSDQTYDLLFPDDNLKELMAKFDIKPVFEQIKAHLAPLTVEHKIYEVYKSTAIEVKNHTGAFVFDALVDESSSDTEEKSVDERLNDYVEGVKKLEPVHRYIGAITVSWTKMIEDHE